MKKLSEDKELEKSELEQIDNLKLKSKNLVSVISSENKKKSNEKPILGVFENIQKLDKINKQHQKNEKDYETILDYKIKISSHLELLQKIFDIAFVNLHKIGQYKKNVSIQNRYRLDKIEFFNFDFKQIEKDKKELKLIKKN